MPTSEEIQQAFRDWCEANHITVLLVHFAANDRITIASLPPNTPVLTAQQVVEGNPLFAIHGEGGNFTEATIDFIRRTGYPWTWYPPETPATGIPKTDG